MKDFITVSNSPMSQPMVRAASLDRKQAAQNLYLFKQMLNKSRTCFEMHPYTANKSKIYQYKFTFFCLGMLFAILAVYMHTTSVNWAAGLLFGNTSAAKTFLTALSAVLSLAAFGMSAKLAPHRELTLNIAKKYRRRVKRAYAKKIFSLSYQKVVEGADLDEAKTAWKFAFEDLLEHLEDKEEKTLILLHRVWLSKSLDQHKKEQLYNEILSEFQSDLEKALKNFRAGSSLID